MRFMRDVSSEMPPPGALTCAFERRARAESDDRHLVLGAGAYDLLHLLGAFGENDAVRRLYRDVGRRVRMLLADRLAGLEALAETLLQDAQHRCDAGFVAFDCVEVAESHGFLRDLDHPRPCREARDA